MIVFLLKIFYLFIAGDFATLATPYEMNYEKCKIQQFIQLNIFWLLFINWLTIHLSEYSW